MAPRQATHHQRQLANFLGELGIWMNAPFGKRNSKGEWHKKNSLSMPTALR